MPTRRTHHASASLRLRATPPATSVSRMFRSFMRRRVITGTLSVVQILKTSPQRAPQATLRRKWRSASRAIRMRSSRVSSRKRSMRAARAAVRPSLAVPPASSTSGRVPTTRISSPSAVTSGGATNQSFGTRVANQARTSSGMTITRLRPRTRPVPLGRRLLGLGAAVDRLELVDDHLGLVALLAGGVFP